MTTSDVLQVCSTKLVQISCSIMYDLAIIHEAPLLNGYNYSDWFDFMECYVEYVAGLEHIQSPKVETWDEEWGVLQDHLKFVIKSTVNKVCFCTCNFLQQPLDVAAIRVAALRIISIQTPKNIRCLSLNFKSSSLSSFPSPITRSTAICSSRATQST